MSTSAVTERWPQRAKRSTIHAGVLACGLTPRTMRPLKRPHRSGASMRTGSLSACVGFTAGRGGVFRGAPVSADSSRAMP